MVTAGFTNYGHEVRPGRDKIEKWPKDIVKNQHPSNNYALLYSLQSTTPIPSQNAFIALK